MKQETIGTYSFGMGGTVPDGKDFYEVALIKIYEYEIANGYPQYEGEPIVDEVIDEDGKMVTLHIATPLFNYTISEMKEHDDDSAENYCTFTLSKSIN